MMNHNNPRQYTLLRILTFSFLLTAILISPTGAARAATLTVTNTNDSGAGSLRRAVADATPGDTIFFDLASYPATITLTSGEISINKNLTILGPGAWQLTLDGNNASRIFDIAAGNVAISGLTLTGGNSGSGNNGGAILVAGGASLILDRSVVLSNHAAVNGGGIHNSGGLFVTNSTFFANNADTNSGVGGAILTNNGTFTNDTFVANSAGFGGGIGTDSLSFGSINIDHCTFYLNSSSLGGGDNLDIDGPITTFRNSILANNSGLNLDDLSGTVTSGGYNLSNTADWTAGTGDLLSQNLANINLGSGQDNGGPTLPTFALQAGSVAIDHIPDGTNGCSSSSLDQRGAQRDNGANAGGNGCDIGAYEVSNTFTASISGTYFYRLHKTVVQVTAQGTLSQLTALYTQGDHPARTGPSGSNGVGWGEYWSFTPLGSGFTVNLTLPTLFTPDANSMACRYTGSGVIWDCAMSTYDSVDNTVTRDGVTAFSDWAAGNTVGPTAVSLSGFRASSPLALPYPLLGLSALAILSGLGWILLSRKRRRSD